MRVKSLNNIMVRWNKQKRKEQSERVKQIKPWLNAHGAVTSEGRERSKMNALKHPDNRKTLIMERFKKLKKHCDLTLKVQQKLDKGEPISDVFWMEFIKLMNELEDEFKDDELYVNLYNYEDVNEILKQVNYG